MSSHHRFVSSKNQGYSQNFSNWKHIEDALYEWNVDATDVFGETFWKKKTKILTFNFENWLILKFTLVRNRYVASTFVFLEGFAPVSLKEVQIRKNQIRQLYMYDKTYSHGGEYTDNCLTWEQVVISQLAVKTSYPLKMTCLQKRHCPLTVFNIFNWRLLPRVVVDDPTRRVTSVNDTNGIDQNRTRSKIDFNSINSFPIVNIKINVSLTLKKVYVFRGIPNIMHFNNLLIILYYDAQKKNCKALDMEKLSVYI